MLGNFMFWGRVTEVSLSVITLTVDQVELTGGAPPSSRNRAAPSPCLLPLGAARQTAFMCARAQSAKFVNPSGTRALAAAMYRSCSGPKYVCSAKYWNISRISWAPG
jgi:hypothetical protein